MRPISIVAVVALLIGCATVPLTGRRSLSLVSNAELARMSVDGYRQVLAESELSKNPRQVNQVQRVGTNIASATERYLAEQGYTNMTFDWEYNVIVSEDANAWAMPGGKIAVYTGLLPITGDDTGLAVVLGHEVAHVLAGHANERVSQAIVAQMGGVAVSAAAGESSERSRAILLQTYGVGAQVGVMLPFSRLHESEADRIGLTLMALAGYDPRAAIGLWERMNEQGGNRPPEFISSHPSPTTRIENIRAHLPEAVAVYEKNRR